MPSTPWDWGFDVTSIKSEMVNSQQFWKTVMKPALFDSNDSWIDYRAGTFQSHSSWRSMTEMPGIAIRMPLNLSTCGWCIGSSTIDVHCKYIFYLCFICAEGNFMIEKILNFWSRPSSYIEFAIFSSSLLSFHLILLQYHWDWTFYCVGILSFTEQRLLHTFSTFIPLM